MIFIIKFIKRDPGQRSGNGTLMELTFITKIICDVCLWFSAAGLILSLFGSPGGSPVLVVILAAGCALCAAVKKPRLKLLALPVFALCAFWISGFLSCLLIVPPCLYCVWAGMFRPYPPEHSQARNYITAAAPVTLVIIAFISLGGGLPFITSVVLPYYIIFLFSGVLTMSISRHEDQKRNEPRLWLLLAISLAICGAAALLLSSHGFLHTVSTALSFVYRIVIVPVLMGFVYLFAGIMWLITLIVRTGNTDGQPDNFSFQDMTVGFDLGETDTLSGGSGFFTKIAVALALIAFVLIAAIIFRRLAGEKRNVKEKEGGVLDLRKKIDIKKEVKPRVLRLSAGDNRQAVRRYYRKFLKKAKSSGLEILRSDTSESIGRLARQIYDETLLENLREVYIEARYGAREITKADVRLARDVCSKLKPKRS